MSIDFDVNKALEQVAHLVQQYGPGAVDTAAVVIQVNAAGALAQGLFYLVLVLALAWPTSRTLRWVVKAIHDEEWWSLSLWKGFFVPFILAVLTIAGVLNLAFSLGALTDAWTWVALFNPRLALAHEAMQRMGGH